jgi:hypothetical protein
MGGERAYKSKKASKHSTNTNTKSTCEQVPTTNIQLAENPKSTSSESKNTQKHTFATQDPQLPNTANIQRRQRRQQKTPELHTTKTHTPKAPPTELSAKQKQQLRTLQALHTTCLCSARTFATLQSFLLSGTSDSCGVYFSMFGVAGAAGI